jgi:hypothetical protein
MKDIKLILRVTYSGNCCSVAPHGNKPYIPLHARETPSTFSAAADFAGKCPERSSQLRISLGSIQDVVRDCGFNLCGIKHVFRRCGLHFMDVKNVFRVCGFYVRGIKNVFRSCGFRLEMRGIFSVAADFFRKGSGRFPQPQQTCFPQLAPGCGFLSSSYAFLSLSRAFLSLSCAFLSPSCTVLSPSCTCGLQGVIHIRHLTVSLNESRDVECRVSTGRTENLPFIRSPVHPFIRSPQKK